MVRCVSVCQEELGRLLGAKRAEHLTCVRKRRALDTLAWDTPGPSGWRPRGALVGHLHEHRGAVTRLAALPDTPFYASASVDGTVKVDGEGMGVTIFFYISPFFHNSYTTRSLLGMSAIEDGIKLTRVMFR